jgi:hypothetical protein
MKCAIDVMLKGQQWERAKGELRALVSMQGSYASGDEQQNAKYHNLDRRIEEFIKGIEDDGLQE